jgi:hypothetical protein
MRLPKMTQWELVELHWADSVGGSGGWHKPKKKEVEIDGCITVGMVYSQSVDRIVVVLSRDTGNGHVDGLITIPTVAITGYTRLGPKRANQA